MEEEAVCCCCLNLSLWIEEGKGAEGVRQGRLTVDFLVWLRGTGNKVLVWLCCLGIISGGGGGGGDLLRFSVFGGSFPYLCLVHRRQQLYCSWNNSTRSLFCQVESSRVFFFRRKKTRFVLVIVFISAWFFVFAW